MTISYPLVMPTRPAARSIRWKELAVTAVAMSPFTYQRQVQVGQGQAWAADVALPPIRDPIVIGQWHAFVLALNGREGHFKMGDPDYSGPLGVATGSPVVDGADQIGQTLLTTGWTPDVTGILKRGDRIGITSGGVERAHRILVDADSDSNGDAGLVIWPRIVKSPTNASPVNLDNPTSLFWLPDGIPERDVDRLGHMTLTLNCMEHLT